MARAECQTGYKPELGFSQSPGHASAPQPWARKTGRPLVSCGARFSAPSTWDNPASPGDKTILVFKISVQRPTLEPLSGSEKAVFQSWRLRKCQLCETGVSRSLWAPLWAWCMPRPSQGLSTPTGLTRTVVHTQASCFKTWDTETGRSSRSFVNTHHALICLAHRDGAVPSRPCTRWQACPFPVLHTQACLHRTWPPRCISDSEMRPH